MLLCQYCSKECKNKNSHTNHQRLCAKNPNRNASNLIAYHEKEIGPWNKGKSLHYDVGTKGKPGTFLGKLHSEETKKAMSKSRKALYESGWECSAGRCLKYNYISPIAGDIKVDGSWELRFCEFADKKQLKWKRNKKRFSYIKSDGKESTYQPDFYLEDYKCYIEVKGYETDLDKVKWSQFPEKLIVLRKKEIGGLDEWFKSFIC
jgi:hypothetical protein